MKTPPYSFMEVDLETLSTDTDAAIVQVGAVFVPANTEIDKPEHLLDPKEFPAFAEYIEPHGVMSPDTMKWHAETNNGAVIEAMEGKKLPMKQVLEELNVFVQHHQPDVFCANAPSFDFIILQSAYKRVGLEYPFKFWQQMCTRTIRKLTETHYNVETRRSDVFTPAHDALADARCQAYDHIQFFDAMGLPG